MKILKEGNIYYITNIFNKPLIQSSQTNNSFSILLSLLAYNFHFGFFFHFLWQPKEGRQIITFLKQIITLVEKKRLKYFFSYF